MQLNSYYFTAIFRRNSNVPHSLLTLYLVGWDEAMSSGLVHSSVSVIKHSVHFSHRRNLSDFIVHPLISALAEPIRQTFHYSLSPSCFYSTSYATSTSGNSSLKAHSLLSNLYCILNQGVSGDRKQQ